MLIVYDSLIHIFSDSHGRCVFFFPDNVHFQQAAQISKALVDQQVDFESMVDTYYKFYELNQFMNCAKQIT